MRGGVSQNSRVTAGAPDYLVTAGVTLVGGQPSHAAVTYHRVTADRQRPQCRRRHRKRTPLKRPEVVVGQVEVAQRRGVSQRGFRQRRESISGQVQSPKGPETDECPRPDELEPVIVKHQVGEVDERREDVLRQVVDAVVRQGQTQEVGQTVERSIVEELNLVTGEVQYAQVVHVYERLTV